MSMIERDSATEPLAFCAGREHLLAQMQQHCRDPHADHRHALVFTGHQGMGKTTLLRQALHTLDDSIFPFLTTLTAPIERDLLLQQWMTGINAQLLAHQFSLSRIPEKDFDSVMGTWFETVYLPAIMGIIRPHRRLLALIDDGQHLLTAADDDIAYYHGLLTSFPQLSLVIALDAIFEDQLQALAPLVRSDRIHRLRTLDDAQSVAVIKHYAPGLTETMQQQMIAATGGYPSWLTRYGRILQARRAEASDTPAFEQAQQRVYDDTHDDFRALWAALERDERLVLTAIARLTYDDPLRPIDGHTIDAWLIETDYSLDRTAIHAALRSLDYRDIIQWQAGQVLIRAQLMQRWLLQSAEPQAQATEDRDQLPLWGIALIILVLALLLLVIYWLPPQVLPFNDPVATATLPR